MGTVIIVICLLLIDAFSLWMIWRLNIYIAKLEIQIEENQELTQNLFISLKTLSAEGMFNANGTIKKIRIQQ